MFLTKLKLTVVGGLALIVLAGGAGALSYLLWAQDAPPARSPTMVEVNQKKADEARQQARERLQKLLSARRDAANEEVIARTQEFNAGRGTLDILVGAHERLLKAEMELDGSKEAMIRAYEKRLSLAKDIHEINKQRFDAARIPVQDLKRTEYHLLEAEIDLLRAQTK